MHQQFAIPDGSTRQPMDRATWRAGRGPGVSPWIESGRRRFLAAIPGDFALPFFEKFEDSAILPLDTLSHKPAIGFAADVAARRPHSGLLNPSVR